MKETLKKLFNKFCMNIQVKRSCNHRILNNFKYRVMPIFYNRTFINLLVLDLMFEHFNN